MIISRSQPDIRRSGACALQRINLFSRRAIWRWVRPSRPSRLARRKIASTPRDWGNNWKITVIRRVNTHLMRRQTGKQVGLSPVIQTLKACSNMPGITPRALEAIVVTPFSAGSYNAPSGKQFLRLIYTAGIEKTSGDICTHRPS